MGRRKWLGNLAIAAALLLGTGGKGAAKPLLQEDFRATVPGMKGGRVVDTRGGKAWQGLGYTSDTESQFVSYNVKGLGLRAQEGTIELDVTRDEKRSYETVLSFADAAGNRTLSLRMQWTDGDPRDPDRSMMYVWAGGRKFFYTVDNHDRKQRPYHMDGGYLPQAVRKGQTVHVALVWKGKTGTMYVNGKPVRAKVEQPFTLGAIVASSTQMIVGAETWRAKNPKGAYGMSHSLISNVQLHDVALTPKQLGGRIQSSLEIASVSHNAGQVAGFSGKLVAGDVVQVRMKGTPGAKATFGVSRVSDFTGNIALDWRGFGVYLEDKATYAPGEINLREVQEYRVYAGTAPVGAVTVETPYAKQLKVGEQSCTIEGLKPDTPHFVKVLALMKDQTFRAVLAGPESLPMHEESPGQYVGTWTVGYFDEIGKGYVQGFLGEGETAASMTADGEVSTDPRLRVSVQASAQELKADEKSTAGISVVVTNANGNPVPGHKVKFVLATTSQYTGVVGGGKFKDMVGGSVQEEFAAVTDLFGKVTATYVAGFAAKTAIIVARDMVSNDTGAAHVKTFIQATAELELEPLQQPLMADGYEIVVTSSDSWLTADGRSQARITAKVTQFGKPVEGHKVNFEVSAGTGSIRTVLDTTDKRGEARAVYTAGKKIGVVLITATDVTIGLGGSVQIELRSDAPAKIKIQIKPEKLPADGHSSADLLVLVTDINDNPNDNTEVEYRIAQGSGRLRDERGITDRNGESEMRYTAGREPGKVSFEITVRSTVPTAEELAKAKGLALAVTDYDFF